MSSFLISRLVFVFVALVLVSCNKAQNLEVGLQGFWDGRNTTDQTSLSFAGGKVIAKLGQKRLLQGTYKLENKHLTFEFYATVDGKKIKQNPSQASVEKLEENKLELNWDGQVIDFARNQP